MDYLYQMTHPSQELNESYGYLWWLNGYDSYMIPQSQYVFDGWMMPDAPQDLFAALGKNGQFINVVPSQNMVWIRMGDAPDDFPVPFLLNNEIWTYIHQLDQTGTPKVNSNHPELQIFPNPSQYQIEIHSSETLARIQLYNLNGQKIMDELVSSKTIKLNTEQLNSGPYLLLTIDNNGLVNSKFIYKN